MYVCMCISVYVCIYVCMYVCGYVRMYVRLLLLDVCENGTEEEVKALGDVNVAEQLDYILWEQVCVYVYIHTIHT